MKSISQTVFNLGVHRKLPKFISHHVDQLDEPDDLESFLRYIRSRGITGYRAGCECYACNANRLYFKNIWKDIDTETLSVG